MDSNLIVYDEEHAKRMSDIEDAIREKQHAISEEKTPAMFVKRHPSGFDYVDEAYIRSRLGHHYPIWSWEACQTPIIMLGSEWVIACGELVIFDNGITRKFFSAGAARVQFKRNEPHLPENVIDIDKNVASAVTNAFKRAANRLARIADDVYRKVIEDYHLDSDQIEMLKSLAENINNEKINLKSMLQWIESGEVSKLNLDATISNLKKIKGEKNE